MVYNINWDSIELRINIKEADEAKVGKERLIREYLEQLQGLTLNEAMEKVEVNYT